MGNVVGIDLGTTNSVAAFKLANVEVVTSDENTPPERKLTRSVVSLEQDKLSVGDKAYNQLKHDPENVIVSIKRLMGRGFSDAVVQEQLSRFGYKVTQSTHGTDNSISVWLGGKEYQPEDISAEILKQVVRNAQKYFQAMGKRDDVISQAVITVPAYFNDKQRDATKTAAYKAGLTPRELLPEPTAAAISYGFKPEDDDVKTILVYDFGGGTLDVSLITAAGNQFIEQGKAGDLWLGGDDIDYKISQFVKEEVARQEGLDDIEALIAKMPHYQKLRFQADLKMSAERAKIELSSGDSVRIIPATQLIDELGMAIPIDVEITRSQFENMIEPLVERSIAICHNALCLSEYTTDLVDVILLVGGSSQIPLVQQKLRQAFGNDKIVVHPRPMYAVAEGAAIVSEGLTDKVGTVSRDYFIKLVDDTYKVISRGESLPVTKFHTFKTVADGQRLIHFEFFSPDDVKANLDQIQSNDRIGDMWLGIDQPYPQKTEVLITLELDESLGVLQVMAALKNDPSIKVSSSFSRGKDDEKIYQELEETIQALNDANNLTEQGVKQANIMASKIVYAANQIIDIRTGEERIDRREDAKKELENLKSFASEDRDKAEFLINEFDFILENCQFLISEPQKERVQDLTFRLKEALARNDYSWMQMLSEDGDRELNNLPDEVRMLLAGKEAIRRAHVKSPTQAKAMASKFSQLLSTLEYRDENGSNQLWRELLPDVKRWLGEDLPTGSIITGITR